MREIKTFVQAGHGHTTGKHDHSFLHVERRIPRGEGLDREHKPVAYFELRYNEDTNEVMLIKGDEIVYSEILDES